MKWTTQQWKDYLVEYPLASSALSITFFLIALIALVVTISWRCIQWCVGCGRCHHYCSIGAENPNFLGDTKHTYLKAWIYLLIAGALGMVVWGMLALDAELLALFWNSVVDVLDYGEDVTGTLTNLKVKVDKVAPDIIADALRVVASNLASNLQGKFVQDGMGFAVSQKAATQSLHGNTTAIRSGLGDSVLPGLAVIGGQFGISLVASTRRRLLAESLSGSYTELKNLNPALDAGLRSIVNAEGTRGGIRDTLQALQSALAKVQVDPVDVSDLETALSRTTLGAWDTALGSLSKGLEAYAAARQGIAFKAVTNAADKVATGADALSTAAINNVQDAVHELHVGYVDGPQKALQSLVIRLHNISEEVMDIGNLTVKLGNGSWIGVLALSNYTLSSLDEFYVLDGTSSSKTAAASFVEAALNCSTIVSQLSSTTANLSAAASAALKTAKDGPNPAPAAAQVEATQRQAVRSLSEPSTSVLAALTKYKQQPTADNLAELRRVSTIASPTVSAAATNFSLPLADASSLESTANVLLSDVASVEAFGATLGAALPSAYSKLDDLTSTAIIGYDTGLGTYSSVLSQFPNVSSIQDAITNGLEGFHDRVNEAANDVLESIGDVGGSLGSAINKIQDGIIDPGNEFVGSRQDDTEQAVKIGYPVLMSCWALGALLLLLLALSVWRNWVAGLATFTLLLLVYITINQAVSSATAFGMAALGDACDNIEYVMLRHFVQESNYPQLSIVLSYYLYRIPYEKDLMLQTALSFNVTGIRTKLRSLDDVLVTNIENGYPIRGATKASFDAIRAFCALLIGLFEEILLLLKYEVINPLYVGAKNMACCDAGTFAYHEWCAMTAMATLTFGALVASIYLLARMDMVAQRRRGCCSCCSCVCYKPARNYTMGSEKEEDLFSKEAKKLHEQQQQDMALPVIGEPVEGGVDPGTMMPSGFMTAEGGVAAAAALDGKAQGAYSAPDAPSMTTK